MTDGLTMKERVLQAAIELVSDRGYEEMSMRVLAQKSGIMAANIYRYFDSKEEILNSIMDYAAASLLMPHYTEELVREQLKKHTAAEILYGGTIMPQQERELAPRLTLYRLLFMEQCNNNRKMLAFTRRLFFREPIEIRRELLDILVHLKAIPPTDTWALAQVWHRTVLMLCLESTHFYNEQSYTHFYQIMSFFVDCALRGVSPVRGQRSFVFTPGNNGASRSKAERRSTAQRLAAEAFLLIDEKGADRVTVRDICDRAGIRTGSFYNHYKSKEELLDEVAHQISQQEALMNFDPEPLKMGLLARDLDETARALAACNASMDEPAQLIAYRVKFREQYRRQDVRDSIWDPAYKHIDLLTKALEDTVERGFALTGEPWKIATAYKYAMTSIHVQCALFEEDVPASNALCTLMGNWFLGLLFDQKTERTIVYDKEL